MPLSKEVDVIGIPLSFGQPKDGVQYGPQRMREAGMIKQLDELKVPVHDLGDLTFEEIDEDSVFGNMKRPRAVGKANKQISEAVAESVRRQHLCLTLGGDHSMSLGSIHGHAQVHPNIGVIWIDAHGDINPPLRSLSGNIHGMPLAFLVSELKEQIPKGIPEFEWVKPCISLKDLSYIALRDLDEAEEEIIAQYDVKAYRMKDVREHGIEKITQMAIEAVCPSNSLPPETSDGMLRKEDGKAGCCGALFQFCSNRRKNKPSDSPRYIHLSFDIDALDPTVAPSTGTAVPGGLTMDEGIHIVRTVAATGRLAVLDIAEVNPGLGSDEDQELTLNSACKLVNAWFSKRVPGHAIGSHA